MSEGTYVSPTPPSPPPPPVPPASTKPQFDFVRPFTFAFEDPNWLPKILIGGLFYLAAFLIVGVFFLLGYVAQLMRNVIDGVQHPLPEWKDLGEYFAEGLKLFFISIIYTIPIIAIVGVFVVPAIVMSGMDSDVARNFGGGIATCAWCLIFPLSLAVAFFLPAALLMAITKRNFAAAFEFRNIWAFIKANPANYLLAIVVHFVANFASQIGVILLCIGIIFTAFWSMCVTGYAFAQTYRLSLNKEPDRFA